VTLKQYPKIIAAAARAIHVTADIFDWAHHKWIAYQENLLKITTEAVRDVATDVEVFAKSIDIKLTKSQNAARSSAVVIDGDNIFTGIPKNVRLVYTRVGTSISQALRSHFGEDTTIFIHFSATLMGRQMQETLTGPGINIFLHPSANQSKNIDVEIAFNLTELVNKASKVILISGGISML
jgi:NYN domain